MFNIRIVKEDISYLEIEFHSNFSLEESKNFTIVFNETNFFHKFNIKIYNYTLKKMYHHFMESDVTFSIQIKRSENVKKKIPLKFYEYNKENYSLLSWIVHHKKLDFLYSYQKIGINFLINNKSAILADDMGLGKTVQTLFAADSLFKSNYLYSGLIVCPNSLIANWKHEIQNWLPYAKYKEFNNNDLNELKKTERLISENNFLLINYEKLNKLMKILSRKPVNFPIVISDEAHRLRGTDSKVANSFKKIERQYCWLITGTPFENNLEDIKNIINILDRQSRNLFNKSSITLLNSKLRQFTLRRIKKDVLKDLPQKHKNIQFLEFHKNAKSLYLNELKKISKLSNEKKIGGFNKLLKICIENKFERCSEIIDQYVKSGSKIVVFSFLVKPLENFIKSLTNEKKKKYLILTGNVDKEKRNSILKDFKDEKSDKKVLLISSFLGSVGLTLTNANIAIFLSEYWNPSANLQAEDRLLRIGQKKEVKIINLRVKDSIEENLENILKRKENINQSIIESLEYEEKKLTLRYRNS